MASISLISAPYLLVLAMLHCSLLYLLPPNFYCLPTPSSRQGQLLRSHENVETGGCNNLPVVVCFVQIGGDDDQDCNVPQSAFILDHPASVKFEVEQAGSNDTETSSGI